MTVTAIKTLQRANGTAVVTWQSDLSKPVFNVYLAGVKIATGVRQNKITVPARPGEYLNIDVTDDGDVPRDAVEPSVVIEFDEVSGADHYRIEEEVDAEWVLRETIKGGQVTSTGRARLTRALDDNTLHNFRVKAVGTDGNVSTATNLAVTINRNPDWEDVIAAYNNVGNTLTLTAA